MEVHRISTHMNCDYVVSFRTNAQVVCMAELCDLIKYFLLNCVAVVCNIEWTQWSVFWTLNSRLHCIDWLAKIWFNTTNAHQSNETSWFAFGQFTILHAFVAKCHSQSRTMQTLPFIQRNFTHVISFGRQCLCAFKFRWFVWPSIWWHRHDIQRSFRPLCIFVTWPCGSSRYYLPFQWWCWTLTTGLKSLTYCRNSPTLIKR